MKKWITTMLMLVLLSGCTSIEYKGVKYTRIGSFDASDVLVAIDPNGATHIEFGNASSDATEDIIALLRMAYEAGLAAGGVQ